MSTLTRVCTAALLLLAAKYVALAADAAPQLSASSPDGRNAIRVSLGDKDGRRTIELVIERDGRPLVVVSPFDVRLATHGSLADGARLLSQEAGSTDETFDVPWGKSSKVVNRGDWAHARLASRAGVEWQLDLVARDDGVGYRYRLPAQEKLADVAIEEEAAEFRYSGDPAMHFTACQRFTTDHELEFRSQRLSKLPQQTLIDLPLLAVWPDGSAAAVTEARLRNFAGLYLLRTGEASTLGSRLSPLPGRDGVAVVGKPPLASPWRVVQLGDSAGKLLESNMLVSLNDPPPPGDYSWAKPGKTTWHWWNGTFDRRAADAPGMNFESHKKYIDFCAEHRIAYHAVVSDDHPWHVQAEADFAPHDDSDVLTPRPELELPRILDYARQRGVGIRLWVHWQALDRRLEEAFQKYEDWGIAGLMVDFLDRDDQQMVNYCERVLDSAARHKLHIQFHGSYKPSGEWRTFPHLFNREGVLNLEYLKWSNRCTPPHNVEVAYVRQLAGPLDYHLGGFRSIARDEFVPQSENPFVLGTRAHHLAMYVVYENPMPMVCDTPEAYKNQPGFEFIERVPTTWDETRFVAGDAGQWIVMARRKGSSWYLGGMSDWTARDVQMPLDFLPPGTFAARLLVDGSLDEDEPNAIRAEERAVSAGRPLSVSLAPGGGFVAVIEPK